jgi:general secretion pathway protein I
MKRGFTLLEVMIGLALLGLALTVLIKSAAGSIFNAEQAHMLGVATDLARGKMYDIEEKLIKDGFTDTDQSQTDWKGFEDEGWPNIYYKYDVIVVEFPSWDQLQAMAQGRMTGSGSAGSARGSAFGSAFGSGYGSSYGAAPGDPVNAFQNSALGGMLSMMGAATGGKGGDMTSAAGGSLIQSQYGLFQQILKVTVRKVKLTVKWQVLGRDRDLTVVAFYTDPAAMDKVLSGMGSVDLGDSTQLPGTGSGSGGGSGSRTVTPTPTPPVTR